MSLIPFAPLTHSRPLTSASWLAHLSRSTPVGSIRFSLDLDCQLSGRSQPARSVLTLERCARARKIRYRLEWLGLKFATKFLPLLSRKACYRLALLLGSLGAMLDRRGRRVALSNLRVAFGDEISAEGRAQIVRESYQHFSPHHARFFLEPAPNASKFLALR